MADRFHPPQDFRRISPFGKQVSRQSTPINQAHTHLPLGHSGPAFSALQVSTVRYPPHFSQSPEGTYEAYNRRRGSHESMNSVKSNGSSVSKTSADDNDDVFTDQQHQKQHQPQQQQQQQQQHQEEQQRSSTSGVFKPHDEGPLSADSSNAESSRKRVSGDEELLEEDDNDLFFQSCAKRIRKLDAKSSGYLKLKILEQFYYAENFQNHFHENATNEFGSKQTPAAPSLPQQQQQQDSRESYEFSTGPPPLVSREQVETTEELIDVDDSMHHPN